MFKRLFIRASVFSDILILALCGFAASAGAQAWENMGLYGGQIYEITIDPDDSDKMFAGAYYGDGLYLTEDGGDNWEPVLTGHEGGELDGEATFRNTAVWAVKIAPSTDNNPDNNIVWATHNYWAEKSTDGGDTWTHIWNSTMQRDCTYCGGAGDNFRYCESLAIDPSDPQTIYVGTGGPNGTDTHGAIYKTTNGGQAWTKIGVVDEHFDPDGSDSFYEERDLNHEFYSTVVDIAIHPTNSNIIWALDFNDVLGKYAGILYLSTDGGDNWSWDVAMAAYMGEAGLVVKPDEPNVVFIGTFWGIVRVEYDENDWDNTPTISYPIGWGSGKNVRALAFDPQNANILYAALGLTENFQLIKSTNGGDSFVDVYNHDYQFIALTVHPENSDVIFGGERLLGVYKGIYNSSQSNYIWTPLNNGINSIRVNDIAVDPNDSTHLLAATMAGVYEKQGSGGWTATASLPYTEAFSVEFDPSDPDGSSYYAGAESRLAKTENHGATWTLSNNLGYPHYVNDIAIDPNTTSTLFITTRYPGSVWKSTNGGSNLTQVLSSSQFDFSAVAIDPDDSTHILVGGGNYFGSDVPGKLYESTSGGISGSWSPVLDNITVNALLFDPDDSDIVYAGCGYSEGTDVPLYKGTYDRQTKTWAWVKSYEGIPGEPTRYGIWGSSASDIFVLSHSGSVVKGGEDDKYILHYDGSWSRMDIPVSTPLYDIWGSSSSNIFAVGDTGTIVHYNGTWTEQESGTTKDLLGVWGSSGSNVFAVGKAGTILHFGGSGWSSMTSGTTKDLCGVWGANGYNVFAVGSYGTILFYNGSSWSAMESGVKTRLEDIWGANGYNVFAVGSARFDGSNRYFTILFYNGTNWQVMSTPTVNVGESGKLYDVWGNSASNVYAVGDDGIILHYNGTSWSRMTSGTTDRFYGVWGSSSTDVYAVGLYGTILHDTGSGWNLLSTGITGELVRNWNAVTDLKYSLDSTNSSNIIFASTSLQGVYLSLNQGGTWGLLGPPPYYEILAMATGSCIIGTPNGVWQAGIGTILGWVTIEGTDPKVPIPDATVSVVSVGLSDDTDDNGIYMISGVTAGPSQYQVSVQADGYGSEATPPDSVWVYGGASTQVDFSLTVSSSFDSDGDGMPDEWEITNGLNRYVDDSSLDPDQDGLTNLAEYQNGTDPNKLDTDEDGMPDGCEIQYGLDPLDSDGDNGADGDLDSDGWTNYEEYINGTNPNDDTSPAHTPPEVMEVNPHHNAGITDNTRVPNNTSFAVRIEDSDGIDATDPESIIFTIDYGVIPSAYEYNLGDTTVVRVVQLNQNESLDHLTKLWVIYDRSTDDVHENVYSFETIVTIGVDAKDTHNTWMNQGVYCFKIESQQQHDDAEGNLPPTTTIPDSPSPGLTTTSVDSGNLTGAEIVYNSSEPITPTLGPTNELPAFDGNNADAVGVPMNLQPPTVFNTPVKIFIPCPGCPDVSTLSVYRYNGTDWVLACDASGAVQPGGEGWMVPGSRVNHNGGSPPTIEIRVYHFTGVQAASVNPSISPTPSGGGGGGGCFIATAAYGTGMEPHVKVLRDFRDRFMINNLAGKVFIDLYNTYSPPVADFIANHDTVRFMVRWSLLPLVAVSWMNLNIASILTLIFMLILSFSLVGLIRARRKVRK
jgi:hypothetical protein